MPIARFQMEDGRIARFEVPEGTTPEQAQAQIQELLAKQELIDSPTEIPQEPPVPAGKIDFQAEIQKSEEEAAQQRSALAIGAGRGLTTLGRAVGIADPETEFERQAFEQLREERPVATTIGEIAGEAAPFLIPGMGVAGIASKAGRVAAMVGLGAAEAGLIARGRGGDIEQQLLSAGIGGTAAGALELALPIIGRIGGKVIRRILRKAPDGAVIDSLGNPSDELLSALKESGQSFDDIILEAKDELTKKAVNPREAARKAFLKSQGIDPTKAQISRTADDFMAQQEAAKVSGRVREALESQEAILTTRFNNKVLETGGKSSSQSAAVTDFVTNKATTLDQAIGDLYRAARERAPDAKNIRFNKLNETLRKMMGADRRAGGNVSAIISDMQAKGILDDSKKVIGRVSVEVAEDLRKLTNELYDPANPFGNMLLRKVKDSLDDDVFRAAGDDFFKEGRKAKAAFEKELNKVKISKFDSRRDNLVRDVLENKIDPDRLVDKVVFSKRWRDTDLKQLKDYISTDDIGKSAFDDMRAEVMQKITDKSFIGAADEAGMQALSRDKLQKALASIGDKKLKVLFNSEERKFLKDMLEVTRIREPVRGTAIGRGPSAQAVSRIERRLKDIPWLGQAFDIIDIEGRSVLRAKPTPIKVSLPQTSLPQLTAPAAVALTQQEQQ